MPHHGQRTYTFHIKSTSSANVTVLAGCEADSTFATRELRAMFARLLSLFSFTAPWPLSRTSPTSASTKASLRQGMPGDIDDILHVVLSAMPLDPQWDWRFPYRHELPEDNREYTRMLFEYFLSPEWDDWIVFVVEVPSSQDSPTTLKKIVSFAVWDISYINLAKKGPDYEPQNPMREVARRGGSTRRDGNPARMDAFRDAAVETMDTYFNALYGMKQIHLQILGTHPDYHRQGHARTLCEWGMQKAREDDVALTLIASPMGKLLYTELGFRLAGSGVIEVPGDPETNSWDAMDWDPRRPDQVGS
ncbi:hypothetical protein BJX76DRAFT_37863 [Aspergillus varians]